MTYEELAEHLVKVMDSLYGLLKGEIDNKSDRQTGPAIGQSYWTDLSIDVLPLAYNADDFDLNARKFRDIYPEKRFAEAGLRARKLIVAVNKRRRELNEGKEFGERQFYIVYLNNSEVGMWETLGSLHARGNAYPFGLFKDSADCKTCIHEFEDELNWFYKDYLPLMAELDDYDWADAPGWGD